MNLLSNISIYIDDRVDYSLRENIYQIISSNAKNSLCDLDIHISISEKQVNFCITGKRFCFTDYDIKNFGDTFLYFLGEILDNENIAIQDLSVVTPQALNQISKWNDATWRPYVFNKSISQLFEIQTDISPDRIVVKEPHNNRSITYKELNERANQLARYLQDVGIHPKTFVGVCTDRSIEYFISILAVMKVGAGFLSLDPSYPSARLEYMVEDAKITLILAKSHSLAHISSTQSTKFILDSNDRKLDEYAKHNLVIDHFSSEDPAYIIYTSGSTGKPKGVVGSHRGMINRFMWMWDTYPFAPNEICCQKTALNFVDSITEIFVPLLKGIPLVIIPPNILKNIDELISNLAEHSISRFILVPSLLGAILDSFPNLKDKIPHLKYWIVSGEALPTNLAKKFSEQLPEARLINLYGSSEVAGDVTYYEVQEKTSYDNMPIGIPLSNTSLYILDDTHRMVPIGIPGELYVGGKNLANGYFDKEDMTQERFIPNPFNDNHSDKLYKTGDYVRQLPDGNIEFIGRLDQQVKIRGQRVELQEVELYLNKNTHIKQGV